MIENLSFSDDTLQWGFPLPRPHTGIAVANGTQECSVWGDDCLCLTVARAGFWDHRGGNVFTNHITYAEMRSLLEAGREDEVVARFSSQVNVPGQPTEPRQVPGGRVELRFADSLRPVHAGLCLPTGELTITLQGDEANRAQIVLRQALNSESFWIEMPENVAEGVAVSVVASYDASPGVKKELDATGCAAPEYFASADAGGFRQTLPGDPALTVVWHREGGVFCVTTALGTDAVPLTASGREAAAAYAAGWWRDYWQSVPRLDLPDMELICLHTYGLYKLAGLTHPAGIAATLQGAWMEETRLPLWSNDYHFNINLQMVYEPLFSSGRPEHFAPLWEMIEKWMPRLRETAHAFWGTDDTLMLPHAVDDRCQVVGNFWKGTIDHASTAWVAQMAYRYYRHTGDEVFLCGMAYPLLRGAFNGFWGMSETVAGEDGSPRLSLPVSVSPEYGESGLGGWGRDSSFQLAAWHCVARLLPFAAERLGEPLDPRWAQVARTLPQYSTAHVPAGFYDTPGVVKRRIALWQEQDLEHSHRHHSHLAGLYPFATVDPRSSEHTPVVSETLRHWVAMGAGQWCAWCLPWAATILSRCDKPDAAIAWLHWLIETHANEGGSIDAGGLAGCTASWGGPEENRRDPEALEVMQLDANMGVVSAIHELLVQCRPVPKPDSGESETAIYVLPQVPHRWRTLSFDRIATEGGFIIGATVARNQTTRVRVTCTRREPLLLYHGLGRRWTMNGVAQSGECLRLRGEPGQVLTLERAV